jgi:hypothetical protein
MATFIPEWIRVSGRNVQIKRVLSGLDDTYIVRRALRNDSGSVDFFVQHVDKGWLAVAVDDARFSEIDPAQLFASERRTQFEQRLADLRVLGAQLNPSGFPIESVVILWHCSTEEVGALTKAYFAPLGIRMLSKERFITLGEKLVSKLLAPVSAELEQWLLVTYFPEAEIPVACTSRRSFHRDNSATLGRLFLDAQQEWASKLDLEMPSDQASLTRDFSVRLINGVAGSGKTLIAVNRALLLAAVFPTQRILLLIHNTPIVADLKERLHRAHGGLPVNLEIRTFFSWATKQWKNVFHARPSVPTSPDTVAAWIKMLRRQWPELKASDAQLIDEINFINETLIVDEPDYLQASRVGRGFALRAKDRSHIWALYSAINAALMKLQMRMWSRVPREICLHQGGHKRLQTYPHILVDEAQFFAPSWFQLVKLATAPNGQLFLCADPNQGFMKNRLSWKSAGIDVTGRTKKLRKSYRMTRAILEAASGVLSVLGSVDAEDYLEPVLDGMEAGIKPSLIYTDSPQDAIDRVVNELSEMYDAKNVSPSATLIIYGDNIPKKRLHERLSSYFDGQVWWFNEEKQKHHPPQGYGHEYLRMAYVDSATGLEGALVFLVGVESLFFDALEPDITEDEQAVRLELRARKLYMAMTRAAHRLVVISSQRLPMEMERLFDKRCSR